MVVNYQEITLFFAYFTFKTTLCSFRTLRGWGHISLLHIHSLRIQRARKIKVLQSEATQVEWHPVINTKLRVAYDFQLDNLVQLSAAFISTINTLSPC